MDLINGAFELVAALVLLLNIREIRRHRNLEGVHWAPTALFTSWGIWNLFYYPSLDQWWSFAGGCVMIAVNTAWLFFVWSAHVDRQVKESLEMFLKSDAE